jgi:hypothetical protein
VEQDGAGPHNTMLHEALYKSGSNFEVEEKKHLERYGSSAILNTRNVRILREKTVVIPNLAEKSRNFRPYSSPGSKPVKKLLLDFEHTESGMLGSIHLFLSQRAGQFSKDSSSILTTT